MNWLGEARGWSGGGSEHFDLGGFGYWLCSVICV